MQDDLLAYRQWFGVSPLAARMLAALFATHEPIAAVELSRVLDTSVGSVWVIVHRLREALDCEALDHGESGYSLTEIGMAECERALAEFKLAA